MTETLTRDDIRGLIPHRDPFLWLDEVTLFEPHAETARIVATKTLTEDIDLFRGHYPDFPILPGVIQLECCFQAAAVLIAKIQETATSAVPVISRVSDVQFRKLVRPGDTLEIDVSLEERLGKAFYLAGKATVGGKVSTRCKFVATEAEMPSS